MRAPPPLSPEEQARQQARYAAMRRKAARKRPLKLLGYGLLYLSLPVLYSASLICSYIDNRAVQRRKKREWRATGELHKSKEPLPYNAQLPINEPRTNLERSSPGSVKLPVKHAIDISHQPASNNCPLLSLPREIRDQIYSYILSNKTFHIVWHDHRMAHIECSRPHFTTHWYTITARGCMTHRPHHQDEDFDSLLNAYWQIPASHKPPLSRQEPGLLYCCQQIAAEAMPILYAGNVFEFIHPQDFVLFARSIPPFYLAQIQSLHLSYIMISSLNSVRNPTMYERGWVGERRSRYIPQGEINADYDVELEHWWALMLRLLASSMPRLEHLKVRVVRRPWFVPNGENDVPPELLDGLKVVRGLKRLEMDIGLHDENVISPSQRLYIKQWERRIGEVRKAATSPR